MNDDAKVNIFCLKMMGIVHWYKLIDFWFGNTQLFTNIECKALGVWRLAFGGICNAAVNF